MACLAEAGDAFHFTVLFNDARAGTIAKIAQDAAEPTALITRDLARAIANRTNGAAINTHFSLGLDGVLGADLAAARTAMWVATASKMGVKNMGYPIFTACT